MFRFLHTSDWHLGAKLHDMSRHAEHLQFFSWLLDLLRREHFDALLVTGDIFDTNTPSSQACELYYSTLAQIYRESLCKNVIIIGGNHDSPSHLDSPQKLLRQLGAHVFGEYHAEDPASHVIGLDGCAVCAIPYLRDRDLIRMREGEEYADRSQRIRDGIAAVYANLYETAQQRFPSLPLVMTGHLSLRGAQISDRCSERTLPVGTLESVGLDVIPHGIAYLALGHLHRQQSVGPEICRYAGAPIQMSLAEAQQSKYVVSVELSSSSEAKIAPIEVPVFQKLANLKGTRKDIADALSGLPDGTWVGIEHEDKTPWDNMEQECLEIMKNRNLRLLSANDSVRIAHAFAGMEGSVDLKNLSVTDVFEKRLSDAGVPEDEREEMRRMFAEIRNAVSTGEIGI